MKRNGIADELVAAAETAGCGDLGAFRAAIEDALTGNLEIIDRLLDAELVEEEPFLKAISERLGMEYEADPEPDTVGARRLKRLCGPQVSIRQRILPLRFLGEEGASDEDSASHAEDGGGENTVVIATYDPFSPRRRRAVYQAVDSPVVWTMASRRKIIAGLQNFYGVGADTFEEVLASRDMDGADAEMKEEINEIGELDAEASVVKFVNQILKEALARRATDIHVEPLASDLRVRYRIDGVLQKVPVPENIKALQSSVIARLKVMSSLDIAEKRLPQDGRIHLRLEGQPIDVRVATIPGIEGESISLRLLGQERFNLERLEMAQVVRKQVDDILKKPNGVLMVTGPTGCGKSTTLYCFLSVLNNESRRIVTIEDPVENKLEGVVQIAVKPEINLTFASGLRSILRGDPNVIMVGEIRDLETAEIAIRASLTGHLVFSTLHTNDALGGISRLLDMGVEPFLVTAAVRGFMAQRLVRRLCQQCRAPVEYSREHLHSCGFPVEQIRQQTLYAANPGGCDACGHTGYRGRLAIYELCRLTPSLQDLIVRGATRQELSRQSVRDGFRSMREYGWGKVLDGMTTIDEVVSVTDEVYDDSGLVKTGATLATNDVNL
ncbi:MAG: Flp pilus assembly complex ATPase component TadA [Verrucomicrobiae bacterium]|nr:Flp pilus assembly complex ATPase component TadA [Verrucomicrobiae bacterium]MCP5538615.1 Flp pilus assembly complex ATPase component TadA [Akkermansiaceae bacterium]MCP5550922.1 Flp pilus assembly complex ATPase component TadA [Akkermansiaceae bacterium]